MRRKFLYVRLWFGNTKFQKTLTEGMLTYNYDLILEIGTKILKIFHIGQFKETGQ